MQRHTISSRFEETMSRIQDREERDRTVRRLNALFHRLSSVTVFLPSDAETAAAQRSCQEYLSGQGTVSFSYGQRVLSAFAYVEKRQHTVSGEPLLDHVVSGRRIILDSYSECALTANN